MISWLNRPPIVGSWRSGGRLSGNPGSPANPGNLWKPCFRTLWEPTHKSSDPVLDLTFVTSLAVCQRQSSCAAWELRICNYCLETFARRNNLTNRRTNEHPGSLPKSSKGGVKVDHELFHFSWSQIVGPTFVHNRVCLFKKQTVKYKTLEVEFSSSVSIPQFDKMSMQRKVVAIWFFLFLHRRVAGSLLDVNLSLWPLQCIAIRNPNFVHFSLRW